MLIIIGIMLVGVLTGRLLRHRRFEVKHLITGFIWVLLFLLGTEAGTHKAIVDGICSIGIEALLLAMGGVIGSTLCAWFLWRFIQHKNATK
ncbi:MAG: LysO family transporter [Prevotellaceae bacterium]|jgi:hypothetical protein|nr:LysO family transporter [Prevotellaceae bacterium]